MNPDRPDLRKDVCLFGEPWPTFSGDLALKDPSALVGRIMTALLTNGIVLIHITVKDVRVDDGRIRLIYQQPGCFGESAVGVSSIGHLHIAGTADQPLPAFSAEWHLHHGDIPQTLVDDAIGICRAAGLITHTHADDCRRGEPDPIPAPN